jgi:hypothetical protein
MTISPPSTPSIEATPPPPAPRKASHKGIRTRPESGPRCRSPRSPTCRSAACSAPRW